MLYFLWGCRGILTLITLRSERVNEGNGCHKRDNTVVAIVSFTASIRLPSSTNSWYAFDFSDERQVWAAKGNSQLDSWLPTRTGFSPATKAQPVMLVMWPCSVNCTDPRDEAGRVSSKTLPSQKGRNDLWSRTISCLAKAIFYFTPIPKTGCYPHKIQWTPTPCDIVKKFWITPLYQGWEHTDLMLPFWQPALHSP